MSADYELGRNDAVGVAFWRVEGETQKAYLLEVVAGSHEPLTLPKSLALAPPDESLGVVYVPKWWADREGLDYE